MNQIIYQHHDFATPVLLASRVRCVASCARQSTISVHSHQADEVVSGLIHMYRGWLHVFGSSRGGLATAWLACGLWLLPGCGAKELPAPPLTSPAGNPPGVTVRRDATLTRSSKSDTAADHSGDIAPNVRQPDDWFEDVTTTSGVRFTYRNGREAGRYFMIESFGGGVGAVDFDRDDDMDLFITGGGPISSAESGDHAAKIGGYPSALWRNGGDLTFTDATADCGLAQAADYSQGCAVVDFDTDGFPDLFVCCYGRSRLYQNRGDGTYLESTGWCATTQNQWHTAATFADFDRDGNPDLFIARYADWTPDKDVKCDKKGVRDLCGPSSYPGTICLVMHSNGDGTFTDWSDQFGLQGNVHGLAVVAGDLNLDGFVDFYVASDVTPNQLYLGAASLPLAESAATAGVAVNEWGQAEGSMGVDVADYDGDGRPDIFVTNFELEDNALYHNEGNGLFLHASAAAGLSGVSRMRVGFGTSLADFDGDGWPDLFVLNGNPIYQVAETPFKQPSQLFRNVGGRFSERSGEGGTFFREVHSGRGNAVVDLDNDGALDLVVVPMNDPVRLLRNRRPPRNYVRIQLRALDGEADATGAWVTTDYEGRKLVQYAVRGTGFFSQSDTRMIFPTSADKLTAAVTVHWPGRGAEVFRDLAAKASHVLIEGRGARLQE